MKKLVTGMLVTSVALAMLVGTEGAYARQALDATYRQQDRGTAIQGSDALYSRLIAPAG